jgi:hypothetical protein
LEVAWNAGLQPFRLKKMKITTTIRARLYSLSYQHPSSEGQWSQPGKDLRLDKGYWEGKDKLASACLCGFFSCERRHKNDVHFLLQLPVGTELSVEPLDLYREIMYVLPPPKPNDLLEQNSHNNFIYYLRMLIENTSHLKSLSTRLGVLEGDKRIPCDLFGHVCLPPMYEACGDDDPDEQGCKETKAFQALESAGLSALYELDGVLEMTQVILTSFSQSALRSFNLYVPPMRANDLVRPYVQCIRLIDAVRAGARRLLRESGLSILAMARKARQETRNLEKEATFNATVRSLIEDYEVHYPDAVWDYSRERFERAGMTHEEVMAALRSPLAIEYLNGVRRLLHKPSLTDLLQVSRDESDEGG